MISYSTFSLFLARRRREGIDYSPKFSLPSLNSHEHFPMCYTRDIFCAPNLKRLISCSFVAPMDDNSWLIRCQLIWCAMSTLVYFPNDKSTSRNAIDDNKKDGGLSILP
jgi:hypothetical protein